VADNAAGPVHAGAAVDEHGLGEALEVLPGELVLVLVKGCVCWSSVGMWATLNPACR
jgi:hypothetical protein